MSTSNKVEFVWKDHELYDIRFNAETVCTLYKTDADYWELLSEAKIAIRRALKSCR